jgi:hypothetical protein
MHIRREIDNLLDKMNQITAKEKTSNKPDPELNKILDEIRRKTDHGKRAKGMWTNSPEFIYN